MIMTRSVHFPGVSGDPLLGVGRTARPDRRHRKDTERIAAGPALGVEAILDKQRPRRLVAESRADHCAAIDELGFH
jgi:hypothetical protein